VLAAVGASLLTAQALEVSLVALVLALDKRHELGAPLEDIAERYETLVVEDLHLVANLPTWVHTTERAPS
jgi:hypothetical protein